MLCAYLCRWKDKILSEVRKFQELGVDKILVNSLFVSNKKLIEKIVKTYGNQFIVIGIDVKKINLKYSCFYNRGKTKIKSDFKKYLFEIKKFAPGEILFQSIDRDGTFYGFDLEILKYLKKNLNCPVLVCGGGGNWGHFVSAFKMVR